MTTAAVREQPLVFDCQGERLLGLLSLPPPGLPASDTGVLIVVGGPQYRAGSHRQFVQLARALAAAGHAALRFDVRGMGDSSGAQRSFEALDEDIDAGISALLRGAPQLRRVVLAGLCDGASAALMYLARGGHARVQALCLMNPWARSEAGLARTHLKHYYLQRLTQADFWRKLLRGGVGLARLAELGQAIRKSRAPGTAASAPQDEGPFQQIMARGWKSFPGPILLLLSEGDLTAKEFLGHCASSPDWRGLLNRAGLTRVDLAGADHTFSERSSQSAADRLAVDWVCTSVAQS